MAHLVAYSAGQLTAAATGSEQGEHVEEEVLSHSSSDHHVLIWRDFCATLPRRHVAP
jgi:hypothetical protein